ncbi:metabotropic glutamate receptor 3-like [Patiria miniata]|uniref:G-protein coupled receptors family 3 profile domain-containing protein n=1 Tax=Patiria miniata TaxID=46514 RepID=A0A914B532_PATMI|nr:metabotropic glutamate receptor 3-like [Patiria miniata]
MSKAVFLWIVLPLLAETIVPTVAYSQAHRACYSFTKPGDVILGGLLTVSPSSAKNLCHSKINTNWLIKNALAMDFAVEDINKRRDLLPDVTLGYDLRDDCSSEELSLWQTLTLVSPDSPTTFKDLCSLETPRTGPVVGLVGTGSSETSIPVSQLGQLFEVPVVSHGAHSDEFSDREKYAYLLRTSTPDRLRVEAILDILEHFGWVYVALLYSADSEGIHGAMQFEASAAKRNVCLAMSSYVRDSASEEDRNEIVAKMLEYDASTVIVTFLGRVDALDMLQSFREAGLTHRYIWVAAQIWENLLDRQDLHEVTSGAIFLKFTNEPVPKFKNYVSSLIHTPWENLSEWSQDALCSDKDFTNCSSLHKLSLGHSLLGEETPVVNAVRAFAHAIHAYIEDVCAGRPNCIHKEGITGRLLLSYLKNVSFPAPGGEFSFNSYGDGGGAYTINNYQEVDSKYTMVDVGHWSSSTAGLCLNETLMRWQNGSREIPLSNCREVCQAGYFSVPRGRCCSGCHSCPIDTIVKGNDCERCGQTEWPDPSRTQCRQIAPTPMDYGNHVVILLLTLSGLGIALCALTAVLALAYRNHALIKCSSRELICVNVLGLTLAFVTGGLILLPPVPTTCIVAETGIAFSFTLSFAPTLLKVVRIYRIFQAGRRSVKRPRFISPKSQMTMVVLFVLIQVLIAAVSILTSPSKPETLARPNANGMMHVVELFCQFGVGFYASGLYNLLLILGCCLAAFKARKVPSNYNESKFIAVSVYSTLVLCLAAVPVYTTAVDVLQKLATVCLAVQLNAYLTLVCVYLPKLCAILSVKEGGVTLTACNTAPCSQAPLESVHRNLRLVDAIKVHPMPSIDTSVPCRSSII